MKKYNWVQCDLEMPKHGKTHAYALSLIHEHVCETFTKN